MVAPFSLIGHVCSSFGHQSWVALGDQYFHDDDENTRKVYSTPRSL